MEHIELSSPEMEIYESLIDLLLIELTDDLDPPRLVNDPFPLRDRLNTPPDGGQ